MKALIVDDVILMCKLLKNLLGANAECDFASNGREGIEAYKSALKDGDPYDLVCLDIMMPVMNGLDALKEIRDMEGSSTRAKILMTTSMTDKYTVAKAIQYGCDGYLLKPYNRHLIEKQLQILKLLEPD